MTPNPIIARAVLGGMAGLAVKGVYDSWTTSNHDKAVQKAYDKLSAAANADTTVYADHISDGPSPNGAVTGIEGIPDLVVKSGTQNSLLIEVETAKSIDENPVHAKQQLYRFQKRGYRRVLAVPAGDEKLNGVQQWVGTIDEELDGNLWAVRADSVHDLL